MCMGCNLFSALTLFIPAPEPAPMIPSAAIVQEVGYSQVQQYNEVETITALHVQEAISAMLQEVPNTEDMKFLRQEMLSLQAKMATFDRDSDVEALLDDELKLVSKRVLSAPGADQVIDLLISMLIIDEGDPGVKALGKKMLSSPNMKGEPEVKALGKKMLSSPNIKIDITSKSGSWGWLH